MYFKTVLTMGDASFPKGKPLTLFSGLLTPFAGFLGPVPPTRSMMTEVVNQKAAVFGQSLTGLPLLGDDPLTKGKPGEDQGGDIVE